MFSKGVGLGAVNVTKVVGGGDCVSALCKKLWCLCKCLWCICRECVQEIKQEDKKATRREHREGSSECIIARFVVNLAIRVYLLTL